MSYFLPGPVETGDRRAVVVCAEPLVGRMKSAFTEFRFLLYRIYRILQGIDINTIYRIACFLLSRCCLLSVMETEGRLLGAGPYTAVPIDNN